MSHDASATWSGFNYQGKVALYHTLTLIKQKLDENESFDFSAYELILENHEDFDIKGPNGFISFHQVKAINETALSKYSDALLAMLLQLDAPAHSSVVGYFHTWKPLNWTGDDSFEQKLKAIVKNIIDNHSASPTDSYIHNTFTQEKVAAKKTKILRQAANEDNRLANTESVLTVLNQIYTSTIVDNVVNRIKQYGYNGALACEINSIDEKVKRAISQLHIKLNIESDDDALDKVFCALLAKLDENVILKHSGINSGNESPILFTEIINIISHYSIRDSDKAYKTARFKLLFISCFEEFLSDEELCSPDTTEAYSNGESNLNLTMDNLLNIPAEDLWHHFKKFNPHVSLDTGSNIDDAFLANIDNLKQYLFAIFRDMCSSYFEHNQNKKIMLYRNGQNVFLPTTIGAQSTRNLVINIMNNSNAISSLFEVTAMLSGYQHVKEIDCFADKYSNLTGASVAEYYVDEPPIDKDKISQISRKIRLINVSTAIEEIGNA